MIAGEKVAVPVAHVAWQAIGDEVVLIDLRDRVVRGLNPLGSAVWRLLDGKKTVDEVAAQLAERVDGKKRSNVIEDVRSFLSTLEEKGLIH